MNIYQVVLAQFLRHFLQAAAGALLTYGITHEMQNELIETTITYVVPFVFVIVAQAWSIFEKRYMRKLVQLAHDAPASTPLPELEVAASQQTKLLGSRDPAAGILIIICLASVVISTGCPKVKPSTIRSAREASAKMSKAGAEVIQANIDAVKAKEISPAEFAIANGVTRKFVAGVKAYRQALRAAEESIKAGEDPKSVLARIEQIFQSSVVDRFLELVDKYGLIPGANSETVRSILDGIRISINLIRSAFGEVRIGLGSTEVTA